MFQIFNWVLEHFNSPNISSVIYLIGICIIAFVFWKTVNKFADAMISALENCEKRCSEERDEHLEFTKSVMQKLDFK